MSEKSPTEDLREEHRIVLSQITRVAEAVGRAAAGGTWSQAAQDIRAQMEGHQRAMLLHFRKEELGIYPDVREMASQGAPSVDILGRFFAEAADDDLTAHHLLRGRMHEVLTLLAALERSGGTDGPSAASLPSVVSAELDLLSRHAEKEDTLVFPMIERLLDSQQMAEAAARMRAIASQGG